MSTIEFPKKNRDQDENATDETELELQPEGEALDLDVDDEAVPAAPQPPSAAAARPQRQGAASIGIALLLIVSLAALAVLWKQRGDLRAQVTGLESQLAEAAEREAQTQLTVGDVAKQLEGIQTVLAGLLGAEAGSEAGSQTEAAAEAATDAALDPSTEAVGDGADEIGGTVPEAAADPGAGSWVDRALERGAAVE